MESRAPWPSRKSLWITAAWIFALHLLLLLGGPDALRLSLPTETAKALPFQTRMIETPAAHTQPPTAKRPAVTALAKPRRAAAVARPPAALPAPETPTEPVTLAGTETAAITPAAETPSTQVPTPVGETTPATPPAEPLQAVTPPPVPLAVGALPPSTLLSYKLTGQERGLTYYASGELRWQHNPSQYEASLTIKAFLVGSRVFSSVGNVGSQGLMPARFADKWRGEKATHFDAENHRIVFSSNKPTADLQPGAQDQVSLFVQLAAAMTGDPERYKPGTSVSIQTATINEAVPWTLTMQAEETVQIDDKPVLTAKWVCLPRGKYDTKVELWLSRAHAWMPVRIRITQVSGSFIDMLMENLQPLGPLAANRAPNN
jgi:hypothetical protein